MSKIEEIVYEAIELGIRDQLFARVGKLRNAEPYDTLDYIYETAFQIEKKIKFDEDKHNS